MSTILVQIYQKQTIDFGKNEENDEKCKKIRLKTRIIDD